MRTAFLLVFVLLPVALPWTQAQDIRYTLWEWNVDKYLSLSREGDVYVADELSGVKKYSCNGAELWSQAFLSDWPILNPKPHMDPAGNLTFVSGVRGQLRKIMYSSAGETLPPDWAPQDCDCDYSRVLVLGDGDVLWMQYDRHGSSALQRLHVDGSLVWHRDLSEVSGSFRFTRNALSDTGTVLIAANYGNSTLLRSISLEDGSIIYSMSLDERASVVRFDARGVLVLFLKYDNPVRFARYAWNGLQTWERAGLGYAETWTTDTSGYVYTHASDHEIVKYDSLGKVVWTADLDLPGETAAYGWLPVMRVDPRSGAVYLAANVEDVVRDDGYFSGIDLVLSKLDSSGVWQWVRTWDQQVTDPSLGPYVDDRATDVLVDEAGHVYVTGWSATIKYDPNGNVEWVQQHPAGAQAYIVPREEETVPTQEYDLSTVSPNPIRQRGSVMLTVRKSQVVQLELVDLLGRRVALLHNGRLAAGQQQRFEVDGSGLPSGVYLLRAVGESFTATRLFVRVH